jgi:hypothetical protein
MSDQPNFLSEFHTAELRAGLAIRLRTMRGENNPGPQLEFVISPDRATDLANAILEAVDDWKRKRQN